MYLPCLTGKGEKKEQDRPRGSPRTRDAQHAHAMLNTPKTRKRKRKTRLMHVMEVAQTLDAGVPASERVLLCNYLRAMRPAARALHTELVRQIEPFAAATVCSGCAVTASTAKVGLCTCDGCQTKVLFCENCLVQCCDRTAVGHSCTFCTRTAARRPVPASPPSPPAAPVTPVSEVKRARKTKRTPEDARRELRLLRYQLTQADPGDPSPPSTSTDDDEQDDSDTVRFWGKSDSMPAVQLLNMLEDA